MRDDSSNFAEIPAVTSNSTSIFGLLDGIADCLIRLAILNHEDCRCRCQNRSSNAKVTRGQSEHSSIS
jgi:hypothetical protein